MSGRRRFPMPLVIGVLLVAIVAVEVASGLAREDRRSERVRLPAAVLVPPRVTAESLRGRPAIVHFWASWCEPCVQEAPQFPKLAARLGDRASLVAVDWSDDRRGARAFLRRFGWTFPVLADPGGVAGQRAGVQGLPTTLILDADGRVVQRLSGPQTADGLLRRLP